MKTKNQIVEILNKFFTPTCIASMNKDGEYSLIDTFEIIADEILQPVTKELTASDIFRYKIYPGNVKKWTGKECDLYIFTIEQINELYAAQHKEPVQKDQISKDAGIFYIGEPEQMTAEELNKIALNFGVLGWDLLLTEVSNGAFSKEDVTDILKQYATQHKEQKQQSGKERQVYHLNCDKCGKTFWSQESFPEPQLCFDCDGSKQITDEEIEIEMDNRSFVTSWDRTIGRTMAKWMRNKSQNQKQK
jgi:hypothetical protein